MSRSISLRSFIAAERAARRPAVNALVAGGRFNVRAIMGEAVRIARTIRIGSLSWSQRMAIGLRTAWARAKTALAEAAAMARFRPSPAPIPLRAERPVMPTSRVFTKGSRAFTHGW